MISEFPTTVEAATAAKAAGLATVAGAPNVVRGGSHSGGVSVSELAERGVLDGLSSDYVPSSLLQAVFTLNAKSDIALPEAMGMVTWKVSDILGLKDRGHLRTGLRADLLRFAVVADTRSSRRCGRTATAPSEDPACLRHRHAMRCICAGSGLGSRRFGAA